VPAFIPEQHLSKSIPPKRLLSIFLRASSWPLVGPTSCSENVGVISASPCHKPQTGEPCAVKEYDLALDFTIATRAIVLRDRPDLDARWKLSPVALRQNNPSGRFSLSPSGKSPLGLPPSRPRGRGVGHRHERWDGMRWTRQRQARDGIAGRASWSVSGSQRADEWRARVRQNRVVLAPQWLASSLAEGASARPGADESTIRGRRRQQSPILRGERVISRKAIAQGMPDRLRWTCMLVCVSFVHFAHETADAARIRHSLRPLISGRETFGKARADRAARTRTAVRGSFYPSPKGEGLSHMTEREARSDPSPREAVGREGRREAEARVGGISFAPCSRTHPHPGSLTLADPPHHSLRSWGEG